jgi:hypothetical protein
MQRAGGRGEGRLHFSCEGQASVSIVLTFRICAGVVQYEKPHDSDTNHSEVIQFTLNPALGQLWDEPQDNFCEQYRV